MSIYKVNKNDNTSNKISNINDMVIEVNGKVEQGKFDINEIEQIISDCQLDRKFVRDVSLGHTTSDYTNWTHLKAESGYSIWKYSPSNYTYNASNQLFFDNKLLDNVGQANSESATSFDSVQLYNGDSGAGYTDNTSEAGTEEGTEFELMDSTNDYLYLGESSTFTGAKFEFQTRGSGYTLKLEYWDGSSWAQLTSNSDNLEDNTSNFESDGKITWDAPSGWTTTTVNSVTKYWIRISTTSTPTTTAKAYYIVPGDSVIGLLALSSSQILNEEWAWCSYGSSIYVTIRNSGNSSYEGNYYITSSSSSTNLKNFFVYNHEYKINYEDSSYSSSGVSTKTDDYTISSSTDRVILVDGNPMPSGKTYISITLPNASSYSGKRFIIKLIDKESGTDGTRVYCESGETIDGSSYYAISTINDFVEVISNGTNWYVIGK